MKRFVALVLSMLLSLSLLCACKHGEAPFSPSSAEGEYARIYPNGQAFDFGRVETFTRKSTISISGETLSTAMDMSGRPHYPATELMEYKYEKVDGGRSQRTLRLINMNNPFADADNSTLEAPTYRPLYAPYSREIYADKTLVYAPMDGDGKQQSTAVAPQKTYESRDEYLSDEAQNFDTPSQRAVPYDLAFFSSFTGKLEGSTYRMTGIVDLAQSEAFFEAFMANYSFKIWYTPVDDARMYEFFLNPEVFAAIPDTLIKVEIVSDRSGLRSVTETFVTAAASRPLMTIGGTTVTIVCTTEYSTAALDDPIVVPTLKAA